MKALGELRQEIDSLDRDLTRLLAHRFALTDQVAEAKRNGSLPVLDSSREREILKAVEGAAGPAAGKEVRAIYERLFELSRARQERLLSGGEP